MNSSDFFVALAPTDSARLDQARKDQEWLEKFADPNEWAQPHDAKFLMRMGENLFRLAFPTGNDVGDFVTAFASAVADDSRLRLWLYTDDRQIARLPWEYLCLPEDVVDKCRLNGVQIEKFQPNCKLPDERTFLALNPHISIIRQARPNLTEPRLERIGALRILIAWANPGSKEWPLVSGVETEVASIMSQLRELSAERYVEVRVVGQATKAELARVMREFRPHVLHYSGHGGFPEVDDPDHMPAPSLVLEGHHTLSKRRHDYLTAGELRDLCAECEVQVVVLNACWGAHTNAKFPGIAYALTAPTSASPVPVVVAMQMAIPQPAAVGLAAPLYQNVALARSVEDGVRMFRTDSTKGHPYSCGVPNWGIPVVFLSVEDSALFITKPVDGYPINFGEIIKEHVPIVGREFLRDKFEEFKSRNESGIFLMTAPPGVGKTAFLSQWITDHSHTAYYFYRETMGTTDPDECVKLLYHGLLTEHGILEQNPTNDPRELRRKFDHLLEQISDECQRKDRDEVIVIDALDEAGRARDGESAVDVLPTRWPPRVYLLITSRPVPLADRLAGLRYVTRFPLDPSSDDNQRDAIAYCLHQLQGQVTDADERTLRRLSERLAQRAEGNFLVLKLFLSTKSIGEQVSAAELEREAANLTGAVEGVYKRFFERVTDRLGDDPDQLDWLYQVLGAFVTAQAPVTPEQICAAFGLRTARWDWAFGLISQFLERGGVRQEEQGALTYRLYHETFRQFLLKKLATDLRVDHEQWANYCSGWRKLNGYARLYALRYLPTHLIGASQEG
jgi:hypothetical protein